jgi:ELWxxDGT repeat protein
MGETVYFIAEHPTDGRVIWRTNGTPEGTQAIRPKGTGAQEFAPYAAEMVGFKGQLVVSGAFLGGPGGDVELFFVDVSTPGAESHKRTIDIRPGSKGSWPRQLTPAGDHVFFTADDGVHGRELWVTDGTKNGTHLVKDILLPGDLTPLTP